MKNNFFNYFILLVFALSLNSCGDGCDCCLGDPCWDAQMGNLGYGVGGIEINEEALECVLATSSIQTEYSEKINDATDLMHLNLETLALENEDFFENYNLYINNLKVAFESEGGNLENLEEKLFLLGEEIGAKIDAIPVSIDIESEEWRDLARLLDLELVEGIVELFSEGGSETEVFAVQFLDWYKENIMYIHEYDDKVFDLYNMLDSEIERLNNERDSAIEALNCA
jgi:hypothetical protein